MCRIDGNADPTVYDEDISLGNCVPVVNGEDADDDESRVPLANVVTSFKFPSARDEVASYSRWNWRLLGSLMLDVTFHGNFNIPGANVSEADSDLRVERSAATNTTNQSAFDVSRRNIRTRMRATLKTKPVGGRAAIPFNDGSSETSEGWTKEAWVFVERDLDCAISRAREELVEKDEMLSTAQYLCTISPLFDIQLPSNSSYVVTLEFSPPESSPDSPPEDLEFFSNPSFLRPTLTLVVESKSHHVFLFYLKCIASPFVITALIWFVVKMYLNDLYISIPDRLLILTALAQLVQNIPTELLVMRWPVAHVKMLDDLSLLLLVCALQLFWAVYTSDKLATNEPWERNSKYYWKTILTISMATITAALFSIYNNGPTYK